jgi:hypothetical protein
MVILFRYVDDIFAIIPENAIEHTLSVFNSYHKQLQFTIEKEENLSLPFLDIQIFRNQTGDIQTKWYSKQCSTNRMINFKSNHNYTTKLNCVTNLIRRVYQLTTNNTGESEKWIQTTIKNILTHNNYPKNLITRLIQRYKKPIVSNNHNLTINDFSIHKIHKRTVRTNI